MATITPAQKARATDAVAARCNNGRLRAYSGTPPADAATALAGNTLLAEATFGATAFGAANTGTGVATANAITQDSSADASGSPSFVRGFESDGATVVFQALAAVSWVGNTAYTSGERVVNGANQYRCTTGGTSAASGGPTGTGGSITDGGVTWAFEGVAELVITNTGGPRIVAGGTFSVSGLTLNASN